PCSEDGVSEFLFAKDRNNKEYYLNINKYSNRDWSKCVFFEIGTKLAIKYSKDISQAGACPASEIVELMNK
ncbi:MAG: hypothetical protein ABIJ12_10590, partial [bacterium]